MQDHNIYQGKLFSFFKLSDNVPKNCFYRRLYDSLDLSFLYSYTKPFYGLCCQESIDLAVFFKICLVGYLENIISDRKLIEHCSLRLNSRPKSLLAIFCVVLCYFFVFIYTSFIDALSVTLSSMSNLSFKDLISGVSF